MKTRHLISVFIILILLSLGGCTLAPSKVIVDEAVITIVEPVGGTQFQVGDLIKVRALVSSSTGAKEIDLYVNAGIVRRDQLDVPLRQGSMLQPWQPSEPGEYLIQMSMTTTSGATFQSNAILITVFGEATPPTTEIQPPTVTVQPPTVTFQPTTYVPEPVITVTPTKTLTIFLPPPSITSTLTWLATITATPTFPTPDSPAAPEPIAPSGKYSCRSTIFLEWNSVYSVNGISYYEWVVEKPGGIESGTTSDVHVEYFIPGCGQTYRWHVRAVDGLGNIGPFSPWIDFSID